MKFLKKHAAIAAASLAAVMPMAQAAPVLAETKPAQSEPAYETDQTGTLTIQNAEKGSYALYQLFTGNFRKVTDSEGNAVQPNTTVPNVTGEVAHVDGTSVYGVKGYPMIGRGDNCMGNIKFADAATEKVVVDTLNSFLAADKQLSQGSLSDIEWANTVAAAINAMAINDADNFYFQFSNKLAAAMQTAGIAPAQTKASQDGTVTFDPVQAGYYMAINPNAMAENEPGEALSTGILLPLVGEVTVSAKATTPTLTKQVRDNTDATFDADWGKAADAGMLDGKIDNLSYKLTSSVAENIKDYDAYQYIFTDILPEGLSVETSEINTAEGQPNTWGVKVTAKQEAYSDVEAKTADITASFTGAAVAPAEGAKTGSTLTWTNTDLKDTLTKAGFDMTYNGAKHISIELEYTPVYDEADVNAMYAAASTLASPDINQAMLSYSNNPYDGQEGAKGTTPSVETRVYDYNLVINKIGKNNTSDPLTGAKFKLTDESGKVVGKDITVGDNAVFTFTGLDADKVYTITETQAPDGYKAIDPISFKITQTYDADAGTVTGIAVTETGDTSNAAELTAGDARTAVHTNVALGDGSGFETVATTDSTVVAVITNTVGPDMPLTGLAGIATAGIIGGGTLAVSIWKAARNRKEEDAE